MPKLITTRSRVSKKIEKFIFKSGSFELGEFAVVYVDNVPRIVRVISIEKLKFFIKQKGIYEAVFRKLNKNDKMKIKKLEIEEKKMAKIVSEQVTKYHYPLKLICLEYTLDFKKIYAYFSAEERLNLSILVKKLFESLKVQVEFRQISRRDIARFMGGIGVCGRNICCNSFLIDLKKICASSASSQDLSTDSSKFTGLCGCLMCCLEYEESMYLKAKKDMPKLGDIIKTPEGLGSVLGLNVVSQTVKVSLIDSPESPNLYFKMSEISRIY